MTYYINDSLIINIRFMDFSNVNLFRLKSYLYIFEGAIFGNFIAIFYNSSWPYSYSTIRNHKAIIGPHEVIFEK